MATCLHPLLANFVRAEAAVLDCTSYHTSHNLLDASHTGIAMSRVIDGLAVHRIIWVQNDPAEWASEKGCTEIQVCYYRALID